MSQNPNPEMIQRFLADPEAVLNVDFKFWNTDTFINVSDILEHLMKTNPQSPFIPRITLKMVQYMKYCYDNNKEFPWEGTFPSTPQKTSKEQFIEYYNSQIGALSQ